MYFQNPSPRRVRAWMVGWYSDPGRRCNVLTECPWHRRVLNYRLCQHPSLLAEGFKKTQGLWAWPRNNEYAAKPSFSQNFSLSLLNKVAIIHASNPLSHRKGQRHRNRDLSAIRILEIWRLASFRVKIAHNLQYKSWKWWEHHLWKDHLRS